MEVLVIWLRVGAVAGAVGGTLPDLCGGRALDGGEGGARGARAAPGPAHRRRARQRRRVLRAGVARAYVLRRLYVTAIVHVLLLD